MRKVERQLRERVKELETELSKVRADRDKFRDYIANKMKWFIEIHGKGQSPAMAYLIEDVAKFFARVECWYW